MTTADTFTSFAAAFCDAGRGRVGVLLFLSGDGRFTHMKLGRYVCREQAEHAASILGSSLRDTIAYRREINGGDIERAFSGANWSAWKRWPGYQRAARYLASLPLDHDELE